MESDFDLSLLNQISSSLLPLLNSHTLIWFSHACENSDHAFLVSLGEPRGVPVGRFARPSDHARVRSLLERAPT